MTYIEPNGLLDNFVTHLGLNVTGSYFLPLLIIAMFIILIALASNIPIEWTALIVLPIFIIGMAYDSNWGNYLFVVIIYTASLLSKVWFLNR